MALLISVYMLHWAAAVFVPLLLGVMYSCTLSPAVDQLQRWHVPRSIGAAALLIGVLGGLGLIVYSLNDEATALIESLPDAAQKFRESMRVSGNAKENPIQKVRRAAAKLEAAAEASGST